MITCHVISVSDVWICGAWFSDFWVCGERVSDTVCILVLEWAMHEIGSNVSVRGEWVLWVWLCGECTTVVCGEWVSGCCVTEWIVSVVSVCESSSKIMWLHKHTCTLTQCSGRIQREGKTRSKKQRGEQDKTNSIHSSYHIVSLTQMRRQIDKFVKHQASSTSASKRKLKQNKTNPQKIKPNQSSRSKHKENRTSQMKRKQRNPNKRNQTNKNKSSQMERPHECSCTLTYSRLLSSRV